MDPLIITLVAGPSGAIVVLWRFFVVKFNLLEKRNDDCETRYRDLIMRLVHVESKVK